jgi:Zn finger protein HypA/HybF involved in hydrogenase expression
MSSIRQEWEKIKKTVAGKDHIVFRGKCPHCKMKSDFYRNLKTAFKSSSGAKWAAGAAQSPWTSIPKVAFDGFAKARGKLGVCVNCDRLAIKCYECDKINKEKFPVTICKRCDSEIVDKGNFS